MNEVSVIFGGTQRCLRRCAPWTATTGDAATASIGGSAAVVETGGRRVAVRGEGEGGGWRGVAVRATRNAYRCTEAKTGSEGRRRSALPARVQTGTLRRDDCTCLLDLLFLLNHYSAVLHQVQARFCVQRQEPSAQLQPRHAPAGRGTSPWLQQAPTLPNPHSDSEAASAAAKCDASCK